MSRQNKKSNTKKINKSERTGRDDLFDEITKKSSYGLYSSFSEWCEELEKEQIHGIKMKHKKLEKEVTISIKPSVLPRELTQEKVDEVVNMITVHLKEIMKEKNNDYYGAMSFGETKTYDIISYYLNDVIGNMDAKGKFIQGISSFLEVVREKECKLFYDKRN